MFMMYLMIWNFGALAGWQPVEILFLYSVQLMSYAIGASFTFNVSRRFHDMAISGTIDEAFIRPMPSLFYLMAADYNLGYISHISLTAVVLGFATAQLGLAWTAFQWTWFFIMIISGAVIQGCMMLICDMPALRTRSKSPTRMFFWEGSRFADYPISIYPTAIQFIFVTVLPFAFVSFYPVQILLGKSDGLFSDVAMWLSPMVSALLIGITSLLWRRIISRYESAGT
jgi:ABC-2 type transport system permease protein